MWCYSPITEPPAVRVLQQSDIVRFGAATRLSKVSDACVRMWSRVINEVAGATLTLSSDPLREPIIREQWLAKFAACGVSADRLCFLPSSDTSEYLDLLSSFDIALDTVPFNGGTTVCHTLYMGTPLVALRGQSSAGRVTASILHTIGLEELIAETPDDWVWQNVRLARDATRRNAIRDSLRPRMQTSALCDAPRFTRTFEQTLRELWREHCQS